MNQHERWVMGLALIASIPFLNQAFHVDDPNFLALAFQATSRPLALYDFTINWGGTEEWAFDILANPPLVPYYLALLSTFAGGREWVFHLGYWPFLLMTLAGIHRLAVRFAAGPRGALWVLVWSAATPGLVLASHTLMPDLPLMACYALGLALSIEGLDRDRPGRALAGGLLTGLSSLCRYSGMTAIPLLLLYVLLHRPRPRNAGLALAGSALPLLLWSAASLGVYGKVHWLAAATFQAQTLSAGLLCNKLGYQSTALGLAIGLAGVLTFLVTGQKSKAAWAGLAGGVFTAALLVWSEPQPSAAVALIFLGFGGAGLIIGLALQAMGTALVTQFWRRPGSTEADSLFLAIWFGGSIVFNLLLLFASVRYLLPALPPVLLLLERSTSGSPEAVRRRLAATVACLVLSYSLATADLSFANGYRNYVASLPPLTTSQRWFVGHWGLQYYLEATGARALSSNGSTRPRRGDEIIIPTYPWPQALPPDLQLEALDRAVLRAPPGLRTFTSEGRACFYADALAPGPTPIWLPYGISTAPLETITRVEVQP